MGYWSARVHDASRSRLNRRTVRAGLARRAVRPWALPGRHPRNRSSAPMTVGPETCYRVQGGIPLQGTVFVQGAKNAALKMIAASLMASEGRTVLRNVPPIEDVRRAVELAQAVGAVVKFHEAERTLVVDASNLTSPVLPAEIARRFRGSVAVRPRPAAPAGRGGHRGHRRLQPGQPQPRLPLPGVRPARRHRGRGRGQDLHQGRAGSTAPTCTWTPPRTRAPRT